MKRKIFVGMCLSLLSCYSYNVIHTSSFPYISGNTFRVFCHHRLDHTQTFEPLGVMLEDLVFVQFAAISKKVISDFDFDVGE